MSVFAHIKESPPAHIGCLFITKIMRGCTVTIKFKFIDQILNDLLIYIYILFINFMTANSAERFDCVAVLAGILPSIGWSKSFSGCFCLSNFIIAGFSWRVV